MNHLTTGKLSGTTKQLIGREKLPAPSIGSFPVSSFVQGSTSDLVGLLDSAGHVFRPSGVLEASNLPESKGYSQHSLLTPDPFLSCPELTHLAILGKPACRSVVRHEVYLLERQSYTPNVSGSRSRYTR